MIPIVKKVNAKSPNGISSTEKTNNRNAYLFPKEATTSKPTTTKAINFGSDNFSSQQCPLIFPHELHDRLMNSTINNRIPQPAVSTIKKNKLKAPRPKNSFMTYRMDIQYEILAKFPGMNNKEISRLAGIMWRGASEDFKDLYREKASLLKDLHKKKYPNYKFLPKKKSRRRKSNKKEVIRSPATASPIPEIKIEEFSSSDRDDITSTITSDNYDDHSCSLSASDAETVSATEELMNIYGFGYGSPNFDSTEFHIPLQYIPHADSDITHGEPVETNLNFLTGEDPAITPAFYLEKTWFE